MTNEDMMMSGFEIVAYAGEARSKYLDAIKLAKKGQYEEARRMADSAQESIIKSHNSQTEFLTREARGEQLPFSVTFLHGQDHLMTALLLRDLVYHMIDLYESINK